MLEPAMIIIHFGGFVRWLLVVLMFVSSTTFAFDSKFSSLTLAQRESVADRIESVIPEYNAKAFSILQEIFQAGENLAGPQQMIKDIKLKNMTVEVLFENTNLSSAPSLNLKTRMNITMAEYIGSLGNGFSIEAIVADRIHTRNPADKLRLAQRLDDLIQVLDIGEGANGIYGTVALSAMNFPYCELLVEFSETAKGSGAYTSSIWENCD